MATTATICPAPAARLILINSGRGDACYDLGGVRVAVSGEMRMIDYRLYHMKDGHFVRRDEIRAASDAEAAAEADRRRAGAPAELWCGPRKVRHYGPAASSQG